MNSQNTYGLSEGIFKACLFLGLKFPPITMNKSQQKHMPSDYFGDDFELDSTMMEKLCSERKWSQEKISKEYKSFVNAFYNQKCFSKHTKTDLNVYFCDRVLFAGKQNGSSTNDYFDFEFYNKSFALRREFMTIKHRRQNRILCNERNAIALANNKVKANTFFADFLHRDWLDTRTCTLEEFTNFVNKHPRFFSKPFAGYEGKGAQIISIDSNKNLEKDLISLKAQKSLIEEIVVQNKELASFCPDSVNTIRFNTFLDIHNVVHIITTVGRFGRIGNVVDNYHGGGYSVIIDPKSGEIISDGINTVHERLQKHPDTGKTFKGFQYPLWEKMCTTVTKMAKMIPQLHYVGWDITINDKDEIVIIEFNGMPDVGLQQAADSVGKLHLYTPLLEELKNYKWEQMRLLGYRVNNLSNFDSSYDTPSRNDSRLKIAIDKLIPDCTSLMDLGCRKSKFLKSVCPANVKYYPVDYKNYDDKEIIVCDFNEGDFPDLKSDTCLCALTAEYVEKLPQFLANMCNAAQKQILMWCRPISKKEFLSIYRWKNPFLTDFTEEFLIESMSKNNFRLVWRHNILTKKFLR